MNFAEFQTQREAVLRERPDILDLGATNLYAALSTLIPRKSAPPDKTVHRCHLASEWCETFGLPPETSRHALISRGVRDSLAMLFRHYASRGARLWLPADNYPIYGELAKVAGLRPFEFPTLPTPIWPGGEPTSTPELLVVTNPLKPLGRWLDDSEVAALTRWLAVDSQRRLVLDTVYTFDARFHPTTLALLATGQTILLHSLTKGWLHPRLFGVALIPEHDEGELTPVFRAQSPPQENLARARELMAGYRALPEAIALRLREAQAGLRVATAGRIALPPVPSAPGYFTVVPMAAADLLAQRHILGIPATAFGSARQDLTILSSLNFLP